MSSFLQRLGSIRKRKSGSYAVSEGSPSRPSSMAISESTPKLASGLIQCHVSLLDDSVFTCVMNKQSLGSTLMDEVFNHIDLLEKDFFGLACSDKAMGLVWVIPEKSLKKQFKGCSSVYLEFRVKFYASDPTNLQEELTRYYFFRQVKKDLLENRMPCTLESAASLCGYCLQAELGDYDPDTHSMNYVSEFKFLENQTEVFEDMAAQMHQQYVGQTVAEAEFNFLQEAKQMEFYGVEQYPAQDQSGRPISLGVCAHGIVIFKGMERLKTYPWPAVLRITYSRKKFYVELKSTPGAIEEQHVVGFHMSSHEVSKRLWRSCIEHHAFFRLAEIKDFPRGGRLRSSRLRIRTGRSERQAVEANKAPARERLNSVKVHRTPSKRYSRRLHLMEPDDDLGGFRRRAATEVRRSGSFIDRRSGPPVGDIRKVSSPPVPTTIKPRPHSATRDSTPTSSIGISQSPSFLDEDSQAMTAHHFIVGETEEKGLISILLDHQQHTDTCTSAFDDEPVEYFDQLNALMETAVTAMTLDELASEGYLMVRLLPDSEGRFGFHVKGGRDLAMPVFISKVKEDSPASECQPPLEEGDQVLYINNMATEGVTHSEVIQAIKRSLDRQPPEMNLVIKPRDLTRVDPTLNLPSRLSMTDPATLLRESVKQLKEKLANGSALLEYDRLYRKKPGMLCIASKLPQNVSKNRFKDVTAYDLTRVHLLDGPVDYINANNVNVEISSSDEHSHVIRNIATQGPMQNTCTDFWQMVWEQGTTLIVMLTDLVEDGKVQCCRYWPEPEMATEYGSFELICDGKRGDNICIVRQLMLRYGKTGETRRVTHIQYSDWPDKNLPRSKVDFLRFVQRLRTFRESTSDAIVIHCSAGVGRTGMVIAMEAALHKMEAVEPVYPLELVRIMRDNRGMMIPSLFVRYRLYDVDKLLPVLTIGMVLQNQYKYISECIVQAYEEDYLEIELH